MVGGPIWCMWSGRASVGPLWMLLAVEWLWVLWDQSGKSAITLVEVLWKG